METSDTVGSLYFLLEYTGVLLAATVGGTVAKRMNFDIVGFAFIAYVSSLSGGFMRDAILNDGPAAALTNPGYLITATVGAAIAYTVNLHGRLWERFRFYADVVTIGVWAVAGTIKGLLADLNWVPCLLLAVITATGGTLARDIVLRRVPSLFTSQKMYVFPAIISSAIMLVMNHFDRVIVVADGGIAADGIPIDVLTRDFVAQIFQVESCQLNSPSGRRHLAIDSELDAATIN